MNRKLKTIALLLTTLILTASIPKKSLGDKNYITHRNSIDHMSAAEDEGPNQTSYTNLADIKYWIGAYPHDRRAGGTLFSMRVFQEILPRILGKAKYREFLAILATGPQTPVGERGDQFQFTTCKAHDCGHSFFFFVRPKDNLLEVCERDFDENGRRMAVWYGPHGPIAQKNEPCE